MQLIIFQIKAIDDVILQHIILSQFYTTVKICHAFSICADVKKIQNLSDKSILFMVCTNHILAFSLYTVCLLIFQNCLYINHCNVIFCTSLHQNVHKYSNFFKY